MWQWVVVGCGDRWLWLGCIGDCGGGCWLVGFVHGSCFREREREMEEKRKKIKIIIKEYLNESGKKIDLWSVL